jgi:hypothetical protein
MGSNSDEYLDYGLMECDAMWFEDKYQSSRGACCIHLQGRRVLFCHEDWHQSTELHDVTELACIAVTLLASIGAMLGSNIK